jgi:hypothetical protein
MEDEYLKKIWNFPDKEIENFLDIDDKSFESIQIKKAKSKLRALLFPKIIGIVLGLGWISFMFLLIYFSVFNSPKSLGKVFFIVSIAMILLFTFIGVFLYVKDIYTIKQIDNSGSVILTQRKLATLQSSIINSVRVLWLQLPFYTTWYISYDMIFHGNIIWWIVQILITGLFTFTSIWLFINISYNNLNKKWVQHFLRGYGFYSVMQAQDYIKEIDNFINDR